MSGVEFLRSVRILSALEPDEIAIVEQYLQEVSCSPGDAVFQQGDEGRELFIVREGRVVVRVRASEGTDVDVAELGDGDFFGEMAIFEAAPRSATCVAVDGGRLLRLRKDDFFALMAGYPRLASKILYRMVSITTGRLNTTSSFLSDLVQWGEGARRRAVTDDLTGLYNRRHLDSVLDQRYADARIRRSTFSLIMMDLDRFHEINDRFGQAFGDQVIAAVAPSVRESIRAGDIAGRYGGDEFVILFPDGGADDAFTCAEAIRTAVERVRVEAPDGSLVSVTTSQGIAEFPRHGLTVDQIKAAADQALYAAKDAGRNRVAIAEFRPA